MNLLQETFDIMEENGKTELDVDFVNICINRKKGAMLWGDRELQIYITVNFNTFKEYAEREFKDYENNSALGEEVPISTCIVFNDKTWLSRLAYSSSEWWEYNKTPIRKEIVK